MLSNLIENLTIDELFTKHQIDYYEPEPLLPLFKDFISQFKNEMINDKSILRELKFKEKRHSLRQKISKQHLKIDDHPLCESSINIESKDITPSDISISSTGTENIIDSYHNSHNENNHENSLGTMTKDVTPSSILISTNETQNIIEAYYNSFNEDNTEHRSPESPKNKANDDSSMDTYKLIDRLAYLNDALESYNNLNSYYLSQQTLDSRDKCTSTNDLIKYISVGIQTECETVCDDDDDDPSTNICLNDSRKKSLFNDINVFKQEEKLTLMLNPDHLNYTCSSPDSCQVRYQPPEGTLYIEEEIYWEVTYSDNITMLI